MRSKTLLIAMLCLMPGFANAQDSPPNQQIEPSDFDQAVVDQWVERLESKKYSVRNEATRQLQRLGLSVIDELEQIALHGTTESADRAFEILKRHHASEDRTLQEAAAAKLSRIAQTEGHSRSNQAEEILNPPDRSSSQQGGFRIPNFPGNLQIQLNAGRPIANGVGPVQRTKIQVKIANGKKDVIIEENGKKLRVVESDQGIRVERTDAEGKIDAKQYEDLDELEKADPEAHKSFQRSGGPGGKIQLRFGAQIGGGPAPIPVLPGNPAADQMRKQMEELRKAQQQRRDAILKQIEERRQQHEKRIEELRRNRPGLPITPRKPDETEIKELEVKAVEVIDV